MSLVETLHRAHLERQLRFAGSALRHLEKKREASILVRAKPSIPSRRRMFDPADERAWMVEIEGLILDSDAALPSVHEITKAVCGHFGISLPEFLSSRRTGYLIRPRHVAYYLCATLTTKSLPSIGRAMGGRDHTTILHGSRKITRLLKDDVHVQASVEYLTFRLGAKDVTDQRKVPVKLTADLARLIRRSTERSDDLSREYGVTICSINNIRAGRTWRNV